VGAGQTAIRRLGPGDEEVVRLLATDTPRTELLHDERTIFLVAFAGEDPIGFVLSYELLRRHGDPSILFVYEVDVDERHRRRGVAAALLRETARLARTRGIHEGFVLTNASNEPAMRLYGSAGGLRPNDDDVMWDFDYRDS
jgi:ribosomal protein S18 acetylase RimI-like enzyme